MLPSPGEILVLGTCLSTSPTLISSQTPFSLAARIPRDSGSPGSRKVCGRSILLLSAKAIGCRLAARALQLSQERTDCLRCLLVRGKAPPGELGPDRPVEPNGFLLSPRTRNLHGTFRNGLLRPGYPGADHLKSTVDLRHLPVKTPMPHSAALSLLVTQLQGDEEEIAQAVSVPAPLLSSARSSRRLHCRSRRGAGGHNGGIEAIGM